MNQEQNSSITIPIALIIILAFTSALFTLPLLGYVFHNAAFTVLLLPALNLLISGMLILARIGKKYVALSNIVLGVIVTIASCFMLFYATSHSETLGSDTANHIAIALLISPFAFAHIVTGLYFILSKKTTNYFK